MLFLLINMGWGLYFPIHGGSADIKIVNYSFVGHLGFVASFVWLKSGSFFLEWVKNGEGGWEKRIGLLLQDAFNTDQFYKRIHI